MALRTVRIFISSPGDVAEERVIARRLIGRLDAQFGGVLAFEAVAWERAPLVATATFQEQIVRPSASDVVVVILWSRLGTALPSHLTRDDGTGYASGTEFEFEDAMQGFRRDGKPQILAYVKTAPVVPSGDLASLEEATSQKRALDGFVTRWFRNEADGTLKAAFHNFAAPADFEDLLESHLTRLAESFVPPGVTLAPSTATWRRGSPFRGLQVFEPEHAPVFFGRTAATASVLAKLRAQGQDGRAFVLIVSMSGAGKSSLIRAGVLPLLLQPGVVGDATMWRSAIFRPADGQGLLVGPLAQTLMRAAGDDAAPIATRGEALVEELKERLAATTGICHLALVVDQLEEVFSDERVTVDERAAFFVTLEALARSGVVWILSSMRSDAYERIAESPTLIALKEGDGQFDLLPPSLREIGQIIRLPAAAAGLRFESRPNTAEKLDDVIRDAAAQNPGALPLLQFLLEELYQRRNDEDLLTFRAYEELGGVEGALAQHAEKVYARVSEGARQALASVLRELVTFGADDESRALRRVAPRSAFTTPESNELIEALLEARLLVSGSGADGTAVVSLAHEALLAFWPRVKTWVEEDRQLLMVHARLQAATREWERNGRRADLLLQRGKPLSEARELDSAGIRLSEPEQALLDASHRRARRFAVLRASAIAGLAVLTGVAGIAAWRAQTESRRAQVQATTAQRTTDFMVGLFAQADPDQSKGDKVTVREVLDRGVVQIDKELKEEPAVRANLLRTMGQSYTGLGLFPKGRTALETAVAQSEANGDPIALTKARLALADNDYQDGRYADAQALYRGVLASQADSNTIALAETGLAEALSDDNQPDEAEEHFRRGLALDRLKGEESLAVARDLDGLGRLMFSRARTAEAVPVFEEALAIRRRLLGADDGNFAMSLNNLGTVYYQAGQLDKAAAAYMEVLPVYRKVFGLEHPHVASALNNLGRVELMANRYDAARTHLTESLAILRKALDDSHDKLILPLNSLGMVEIEQGDYPEAAKALGEAARIARERHHWALNQIVGNLADLESRQGRCQEADDHLQEAERLLTAQYPDKIATSERWRSSVLNVIRARCLATREPDRARRLLSDSLPLLQSHFGANNLYDRQAESIYKTIAS